MNSAAGRKKSGSIALVVDERLTRDRRGALSRVVNSMRHYATVQIIDGTITEDELLSRLRNESFNLVLVPWHIYLKWSKLEAFFGLTRANGPTVAGYGCEAIDPHEIGAPPSHLRSIFFDFADTHPHEVALLVQSLMDETRRTGVRALLDPSATIYCENWYGGQGQGWRIDTIMGLPELSSSEWLGRAASIRLALGAFWSLIYEEGPGKSELSQAISGGKTPRACLQLGCDAKAFVLRLWYNHPGSSAKSALTSFWPDPASPSSPAQILLKYADFLRVHPISDGQDVEITVGFFKSAPAERAHRRLHTHWIEPISPNLVTEAPFEAPGPAAPHLKALPAIPGTDGKPRTLGDSDEKAKERFIFEAAVKIRELKKALSDRDELIRDLKAGGVGTSIPLPPPDAEALIEAFQQKYFEARFQIRQFEVQIFEMEKKGATSQEVESLRLKMSALTHRQEDWIRSLAKTLATYREAKKSAGS